MNSLYADAVLPHRVSPFGYLRIEAYLQLPEAFRSLSRPSSAPDAKAFPLRSFMLDLPLRLPPQLSNNKRDGPIFGSLSIRIMQTHLFYQQNCNYPFAAVSCLNVSLLLPSHNLHQMSQCSVFKVHLELSLIETIKSSICDLMASINAISGAFSPRFPNRSPAQRVRFGEGRRSQRNAVFAHFSQRENGM